MTPQPLDPGQAYAGGGRAAFKFMAMPNSDGNFGRFDAVRLSNHTQAWSSRWPAPLTSGALPTAGGLVFAGSLDRYFRAYDDTNGRLLWQTRLSNAVVASPISYSVNGKQYVAVVTSSGSLHTRALNTLVPEIKNPEGGSVLSVFELQ